MRVSGEGGEGNKGMPSGDVMVNIRVGKDPYFSRENVNVHVDMPISLLQAVQGGKVDVLTLGGVVGMVKLFI